MGNSSAERRPILDMMVQAVTSAFGLSKRRITRGPRNRFWSDRRDSLMGLPKQQFGGDSRVKP